MEIFLDDDMFKSTIRKCWNWEQKHYKGEDPNGERNVFHENRLRQSIKIYSGTQSVSNFRPTGKLIYEKWWRWSCMGYVLWMGWSFVRFFIQKIPNIILVQNHPQRHLMD